MGTHCVWAFCFVLHLCALGLMLPYCFGVDSFGAFLFFAREQALRRAHKHKMMTFSDVINVGYNLKYYKWSCCLGSCGGGLGALRPVANQHE